MVASGAASGRESGRAAKPRWPTWCRGGRWRRAAFSVPPCAPNLEILSPNKAFSQKGRKFPAGSLVVPVKDNKPGVHEVVARLAKESGAEVIATDTSWVDEGIDFGSDNTVHIPKPAVAILWDEPTSASGAGNTRFVLERQFGYPVTPIRVETLRTANLQHFNVLIVPSSSGRTGYRQAISAAAIDRLKSWVRGGGVIIGVESGVSFLADKRVGLLEVAEENRAVDEKGKEKPAAADSEKPAEGSAPGTAPTSGDRVPGKVFTNQAEYEKAIQAQAVLPDAMPGVLVRATVDPDNWLGAGVAPSVNALISGRAIYTPIKLNHGVNVAVFAAADQLVASGYMWEENKKQLAFKPLVVVQQQGSGQVIGFTADPAFRAYMDGLDVLLLNAVFRGAAMAHPNAEFTE